MADVSHELGALRFVVDSPLSSKVAMFNNQANQHKQSQLLNPFSSAGGGRASPKPTFSKNEYGKPLAGSLTEFRGQKANIHVLKEMVELCQIIDSEGYKVNDEPNMRVIPFGELFNIYNYISDKVVGILLRARKHKLVEFEGEMLFQRRDDDVPVFLVKPIQVIRKELEDKIDEIKRASSPAPQATSVLLDISGHYKNLRKASISAPGSQRNSKSRSPSPTNKKAASPPPSLSAAISQIANTSKEPSPADKAKSSPNQSKAPTPPPQIAPKPTKLPPSQSKPPTASLPTLKSVVSAPQILVQYGMELTDEMDIDCESKSEIKLNTEKLVEDNEETTESIKPPKDIAVTVEEVRAEDQSVAVEEDAKRNSDQELQQEAVNQQVEPQQPQVELSQSEELKPAGEEAQTQQQEPPTEEQVVETEVPPTETANDKADVNNNDNNTNNAAVVADDLPTIVIETSAVFVRNSPADPGATTEIITDGSESKVTLPSTENSTV